MNAVFNIVEKAIARTTDCKPLPDSFTLEMWHTLIVGKATIRTNCPRK